MEPLRDQNQTEHEERERESPFLGFCFEFLEDEFINMKFLAC